MTLSLSTAVTPDGYVSQNTGAPPPTKPRVLIDLARTLLPDLVAGRPLQARRLREAAEDAFGASDADGAWTWKDVYDATEAAAVLLLLRFGPALHNATIAPDGSRDGASLLRAMERISALLPPQTRRSEDGLRYQQFSTPLPLGAVAALAAGVRRSDIVLEPSAGTGLLAVHTHIMGARLVLN